MRSHRRCSEACGLAHSFVNCTARHELDTTAIGATYLVGPTTPALPPRRSSPTLRPPTQLALLTTVVTLHLRSNTVMIAVP